MFKRRFGKWRLVTITIITIALVFTFSVLVKDLQSLNKDIKILAKRVEAQEIIIDTKEAQIEQLESVIQSIKAEPTVSKAEAHEEKIKEIKKGDMKDTIIVGGIIVVLGAIANALEGATAQ